MTLTAGFLFLMTGSVTIPIKALVMNMLSVSAAIGLQVLIFQDGHLSGPLGFTPIGGLEESSLVLMLVVAFALATDYEVFVIARIKEAHDHGLPDREAIALGIERTGRIVTAAALLFCVAIGALTTSAAVLHQTARPRRRARGRGRREHRQGAVGAVTDGADGQVELVGAEAAAAVACAYWGTRDRSTRRCGAPVAALSSCSLGLWFALHC